MFGGQFFGTPAGKVELVGATVVVGALGNVVVGAGAAGEGAGAGAGFGVGVGAGAGEGDRDGEGDGAAVSEGDGAAASGAGAGDSGTGFCAAAASAGGVGDADAVAWPAAGGAAMAAAADGPDACETAGAASVLPGSVPVASVAMVVELWSTMNSSTNSTCLPPLAAILGAALTNIPPPTAAMATQAIPKVVMAVTE